MDVEEQPAPCVPPPPVQPPPEQREPQGLEEAEKKTCCTGWKVQR